MKDFRKKLLVLFSVAILAIATSSCGIVSGMFDGLSGIIGLSDTGTVIANTAQIRSSYAVVAADLLEVKRGDKLEILEETDFEKVHWYRVRANDEDQTEGWIEAQNVITGTLLEKSQKLAAESKELQPQATAQLRAASNFRLTPEQTEDNLLFKLEGGTPFDIIGWKYVPKEQDVEVEDSSTTPSAKPKTKNAEIEAAKESNTPEDLSEKYDIWYKIRLDPSRSPAPVGWVFGRQVILQIPNDIAFYQPDNRKFVTWQRLDTVAPDIGFNKDDSARTTKPGSWVVLTRSNFVKSKDGNEPDFDGLMVFGYDKYNGEHYTVYRNDKITGNIPIKVTGPDGNKSFTISIFNASGQLEEKTFVLFKDAKGRLKITPPADLPK